MKKILLLTALVVFVLGSYAQKEGAETKSWKTGGDFSLTFNEVYLTNWAAGGKSAVSGNTFLNLFANYSQGKISWSNTFNVAYGMSKVVDEDLKKTDDRLAFASMLGYKISEKVDVAALLDFKTQMGAGYDKENVNVISRFLAPAYLVVSTGVDYKPSERFSFYFSPFAMKSTFVYDDSLSNLGVFGVDAGKKYKAELGGFMKSSFKQPLMKNIDFLTTLDLFSNYFDNPQRIDVDWQVQLNMKINDFISANLHTHLIYDYDVVINDKNGLVQFKELFGAGLSYKF